MRFTPILIVLTFLAARPAAAAEHRLTLDPAATEVTFVLDATGHDVHGTVPVESGEIRFDPQSGTASGEVVLDAAGADTGNKSRDKKMHSEVLESSDHPRITFRPQRGEGSLSGGGELRIHGSLEIHGGRHAVTLPAKIEVEGDRFTARAELTVPYVEWGMEDPSILFLRVGKQVQVSITARGTISGSSGSAAGSGT